MKLTRRRFLTAAAAGVVEAGVSLRDLARAAEIVSANDKIVVAHIGVGGMGAGHVSWFAGFPEVETAAVCDVDSTHAEKALAHLKKIRPDTSAIIESDFRRVLDRPDIDVITYATPDHWHALNAILAFQAGKHVYGEKPLSYDMIEGQAMLKACRRYRRVFQLGTQIHAGDNYHRVAELVKAGVVGTVHTVRLWKVGGDMAVEFAPDSDPPPTLDWDMWLGPAPKRPYNPRICPFTFRYYWDYSGGVFADFWCHIADLAFWALDLGAPLAVSASGSDPLDHMVTTPGFMDAEFEFPNLKMYWHSRRPDIRGAGDRDPGIQFVGTRGELVASYDSRAIYVDDKEYADIPEVPATLPRSPGHQRNFLDCVKSGAETESNLAYASRMTLPMHLAQTAYRLGRKLTWDAQRGEFVGDQTANRMRHRPYRAPWHLPGQEAC
jgi:predicted dehydrogenase